MAGPKHTQVMDCGYEFINARIRGMRSRMAEHRRLDQLCRSRNLFDLAEQLFPGREFASHLELERAVVTDHAGQLIALLRYLNPRDGEFYHGLMMRYVIENVKVTTRVLGTPGGSELVEDNLVPLPPPMEPTVSRLASLGDLEGLPELFDREHFRRAADSALAHFKRTNNLYYFEATLDRATFTNLVELARRYRGSVRRGLAQLLDTEIAIYNALFLLRGRTLHNMDYQALREFLVETTDPETTESYRQLVHVEDLKEFASRLPNRQLRKLSHKSFYTDYEFEQTLWHRLFELANRTFYKAILELPGLVAFTYVKRMELLNLLRLIEGLRYGMGPQHLSDAMVRV
ncbi:MAG: V-type ATPase subunit [Planctomycetota bacterium]